MLLLQIDSVSFMILCAMFTGLLIAVLLPWLAWSGLLTRSNYVDDQPDTRILSLAPNGDLPPGELSCGDLGRVQRTARPSRDIALFFLQQQNPNSPPPAAERARVQSCILNAFHESGAVARSSASDETLPPQEISVANAEFVENGPRPDSEAAIKLNSLSDETPLPSKERETRRRTRMIEVLHRAQQ